MSPNKKDVTQKRISASVRDEKPTHYLQETQVCTLKPWQHFSEPMSIFIRWICRGLPLLLNLIFWSLVTTLGVWHKSLGVQQWHSVVQGNPYAAR